MAIAKGRPVAASLKCFPTKMGRDHEERRKTTANAP